MKEKVDNTSSYIKNRTYGRKSPAHPRVGLIYTTVVLTVPRTDVSARVTVIIGCWDACGRRNSMYYNIYIYVISDVPQD